MKKFNYKNKFIIFIFMSAVLTACSNSTPTTISPSQNLQEKEKVTVPTTEPTLKPDQVIVTTNNKSLYTLPGAGKKIDFTIIGDNPNYIGSLNDLGESNSQVFLIRNKEDFEKFFTISDPIDFEKENILAFVFVSPANQFKSKIKNMEIIDNNLVVDYRYQFVYTSDQMLNDYIRPRTFMIKFNKVNFDLLAIQKQPDIIE